MVNYVLNTGPLSVDLDADAGWQTYSGGVMASCGTNITHSVQAVGVDTVNGYWILRNQWSAGWGENGFIRLKLVRMMCIYVYISYTYLSIYVCVKYTYLIGE